MMDESRAGQEVDILFFQIGDEVYGADASQVLRIDRSLPEDLVLASLGQPRFGTRAIVFESDEGEGHLKVDSVRGVRAVPPGALRRLPLVASPAPFAIGVCLDEARPVLLIDLVETLKSQGRH